MTVDTSPELLHRMAADPHGYSEVFLRAVLQAVAAEKSRQPAGWIRQHPDGTLTGEFLSPAQIEPARKASGAWVPVYRDPQPTPRPTANSLLRQAAKIESYNPRAQVDATALAQMRATLRGWHERAVRLGADGVENIIHAAEVAHKRGELRCVDGFVENWFPPAVKTSHTPTPTPTPPAGEHCAAVLLVEPAVLAKLLQLPTGAYIDHVEAPCDQPGTLRMRVRGAGWPVMLDHVLRQSTGRLTRRFTPEGDELLYEVDWGFPGAEPSPGQQHDAR